MKNQKTSRLNTQSVLAMKGSGYYSQRTAGAKIAIDSTKSIIEKVLSSLPETEILRFADFGCADGGTSQELWFNIISQIRKGGDSRPIEMIYTDLASNDFSTLFKSMQGMGENSEFAYQTIFDNVYVYGCGTGFHQKLLPTNSLSLGFSATAMHYVSKKPCQIKDHVHMIGANSSERKLFEEQAMRDWESILLARSNELISGGKFVCINFGIDEMGRFLGNTGGHSMFDRFYHHWSRQMQEGLITEDEFHNATFSQHYRTVEEFTRPFRNKNNKVSESGLVLNSCSTMLTPCPYWQEFERNRKTMTSLEYAKKLIPTTRSWSETVFKTALEGRDPSEIDHIVDKFYKSYEAEVAANPEGHAMDYVHVVMEIEKA